MRRSRIPKLRRTIGRLDILVHTRFWWLPTRVQDLVCALYDWSLGMTWREARS